MDYLSVFSARTRPPPPQPPREEHHLRPFSEIYQAPAYRCRTSPPLLNLSGDVSERKLVLSRGGSASVVVWRAGPAVSWPVCSSTALHCMYMPALDRSLCFVCTCRRLIDLSQRTVCTCVRCVCVVCALFFVLCVFVLLFFVLTG